MQLNRIRAWNLLYIISRESNNQMNSALKQKNAKQAFSAECRMLVNNNQPSDTQQAILLNAHFTPARRAFDENYCGRSRQERTAMEVDNANKPTAKKQIQYV